MPLPGRLHPGLWDTKLGVFLVTQEAGHKVGEKVVKALHVALLPVKCDWGWQHVCPWWALRSRLMFVKLQGM